MSDAADRETANSPDPVTQLVSLERRDDGVAVITLSNGKVNALCVELLDQLRVIAAELTEHTPRAVVVTGGPKLFAAGADISQFTQSGADEPFAIAAPERVGEIGAAFLGALNAVAAIPCPTIAAVSGVALGGGCELALACDFRVAGTSSRFGQPEILLGIIPGGGGTQRLARLVGAARAKDLVFSGRTVAADEALTIGLVDRVVEPDEVFEAALAWAATFAAGPRHALALAKAAIDEGLEQTLEQGLLTEQRRFVQSFTTPDAAVGVRSFLAEGPGKAVFD
jgi:enoyl-CoA hydratase/carnithine racemase